MIRLVAPDTTGHVLAFLEWLLAACAEVSGAHELVALGSG